MSVSLIFENASCWRVLEGKTLSHNNEQLWGSIKKFMEDGMKRCLFWCKNIFEIHAYQGSSKNSWNVCIIKKTFRFQKFLHHNKFIFNSICPWTFFLVPIYLAFTMGWDCSKYCKVTNSGTYAHKIAIVVILNFQVTTPGYKIYNT